MSQTPQPQNTTESESYPELQNMRHDALAMMLKPVEQKISQLEAQLVSQNENHRTEINQLNQQIMIVQEEVLQSFSDGVPHSGGCIAVEDKAKKVLKVYPCSSVSHFSNSTSDNQESLQVHLMLIGGEATFLIHLEDQMPQAKRREIWVQIAQLILSQKGLVLPCNIKDINKNLDFIGQIYATFPKQ